jgi:putative tricarboxylic transport membrane protein
MEMLGARADKTQETVRSAAVDRGVIMVIAAVVVWTAVYFVLFEPLGYVIASTIYLIALTVYFNPGRWVMNVTTSALFTIISYLMFSKLLGVTLAKGILPF